MLCKAYVLYSGIHFCIPPIHHPRKKNCGILSLLAERNVIFSLYGAFLENSPYEQNLPSHPMLGFACKGRESLSFFLRLAALCMVLLRRFKILFGARSEGSNPSILTMYENDMNKREVS